MKQNHSNLGILSLCLSVAFGIVMFLSIALSAVLDSFGFDEDSLPYAILGLFVVGSILIALAALVLGIAGFFERNRSPLFPALGTIFSAILLISTTLLVIAGLFMDNN